ncbi:murein L,D-transpeptidase [Noviherbaspirillum saxi]|uniref:Murein L,D-transpeptidase n=1 Tax=Noviherbaspirillum saxi TaxID=2320863 RepID=A0A3A3FI00_9BURK|nr:murein L,D-transpeptidase [Noviherbaspirillum saxi]RJF92144.1 murein L,D-transpeptidase [Noviherbaspirillum saxi]
MVVVNLALASICFAGNCFPALVGDNTPAGTFSLSHQQIPDPGYGGDILVYKENRRYLWAIHRVYTLNPAERRMERLKSAQADARRSITNGCINVMPDVYQKLVDCCSRDVLVIL